MNDASKSISVASDDSVTLIQQAERQLVEQCLAGDDEAWERLFRLCQRSLLLSVKLTLGPQAADEDLVDEIAAQVWLWLVENDRRLRSFDPLRGRLTTYLAVLWRESVRRFRRSESRRGRREAKAGSDGLASGSMEAYQSALADFLPLLTPKEREFCEHYLLASPADIRHGDYSPENARQLRHRVFTKLKKHLSK